MPERYEIHDVITMHAMLGTYPGAFVAAGEKSRRFYCLHTLQINQSAMNQFFEELKTQSKHPKTIIFYPTWEDADGMLHDVLSDNCYACNKPLRSHGNERPDDRPTGMGTEVLQERDGQGPAGKHRRARNRSSRAR